MSERTNARSVMEEVQRVVEILQARERLEGYDPFGFNPSLLGKALPVAAALYRHYFRVLAHGIEKVPQGQVILIANHSGQIPLDGLMIATALALEAEEPRMTRAMVEKWVPTIPFISMLFSRLGQVVGTPENARLLLRRGGTLMVFPEGSRGISKTWDKRYQLEEFGLGFMRLALRTGTPIVPVSVVGAEEQIPTFWNARGVAKLFGIPALPIGPTFMLPMPVRYRIYFHDPILFEGDPDDEDRAIRAKVDAVKKKIEEGIERGLRERPSLFA